MAVLWHCLLCSSLMLKLTHFNVSQTVTGTVLIPILSVVHSTYFSRCLKIGWCSEPWDDGCNDTEITVHISVLHCVYVGYNPCPGTMSVCSQGRLLTWRVVAQRSWSLLSRQALLSVNNTSEYTLMTCCCCGRWHVVVVVDDSSSRVAFWIVVEKVFLLPKCECFVCL